MCGRFTLTPDNVDEVATRLGIAPSEVFDDRYQPRWNIAPMQEHWVVRETHEERRVEPAVWGLAGSGARTGRPRPINVRAESVLSGAFRTAYEDGHCVVPADGFFEWTGEGKARRPFWFHRPDREVFGLAGLMAEASGPDGSLLRTFTILSTAPNDLVARVHDRMPVILENDDAVASWLFGREPANRLGELLRPAAPGFLEATAVSTRVNSVRHDDAACLAPAEAETQAPLL